MKQTPEKNHGPPEPQVPEELARDLTAHFGRGVAVPGDVDRHIMAQARRRFAQGRVWPRFVKWAGAITGAAAAVFLVVHLTLLSPAVQPEKAMARPDTVTILDAFRLARLIKQGGTPAATWDMNRDGAIDHTDVDLVAYAAVSLEGRIGS